MIKDLKMTVLIDNMASEPFAAEWGLSIWIEADGRKILLDTGAGSLFTQNARLLGLDLADIELGVLSHAHYDHADGMEAFFAENEKAPFLLREGSGENCYGIKDGELSYDGIRRGTLEQYAGRICYVEGTQEIADGIWLVPHRKKDYSPIARQNDLYVIKNGVCCPDDFSHEQSLVFETEKGLVVFNSCSHTGMGNILEDIAEMLDREDVYAYVGGLHLYHFTDEQLLELCNEIRCRGVAPIFTGHCTGDHAFQILKQQLGDRIVQFSSGFQYSF